MTTSVDTSYGSWPATTPPFITKYGVVTNPSTSFSTGVVLDPYGAPPSLFINGEQGVWYDPSDFSTMFQDSTGTTPVTAVEQPVGLMLDKSKGLVLGPELVVNGTFDSAAGWTLVQPTSGSVAITGGQLTINTLDGSACWAIYSAGPVVAGKVYEVVFDIISVTGGGVRLDFGGTTGQAFTTTGQKHLIITASSTGAPQLVRGGGASSATIDNISVRELPGNHATQATSTKRPVLSARVNLLTKTEDFSDAVWTKGATTASGMTIIPTTANSTHNVVSPSIAKVAVSLSYNVSGKALAAGYSFLIFRIDAGAGNGVYVAFNVSTGTISTAAGTSGVGWSAGDVSISLGDDGYYKYSITFTTGTETILRVIPYISNATGTGFSPPSFIGDGVSGISMNISLVPADQASLPYQRVNTATDYDTVGFKHYLKFDGVDDALATGSIDFTATDKMTVFAGVRKLSDAATAVCAELSASAAVNVGVFALFAPRAASGTLSYSTGGTIVIENTSAAIAGAVTKVLTAHSSISAPVSVLRVSGVQTTVVTSQGTGNYGNYPLYIGQRGGTTLPFNGHLYSLIVRGAQSTDAQIVSAETYVNGKTNAY